MPRLIFTVTDEMADDLKAIAKKRNMPMATLIRVLLTEAIAPETGKAPDSYRVEVGGRRERDQE